MTLAPCHICHKTLVTLRGMKSHIGVAHGPGLWGQYWEMNVAPPCKRCGKKIPYRTDGQAQARQYCCMQCAKVATVYRGADNANWRGGTWSSQGYVMRGLRSFTKEEQALLRPMYYPDGVTSNYRGVGEHRALIALSIGRPLTRDEHVHHKNGVRSDNRLENLELVVAGHGAGFSSNVSMRCPSCTHTDIARNFVL